MNYAFNLKAYLGERFPGLELGAALFYRWPVGIRFELAMSQIPQRAMALYEACFGLEDKCVVISLDYDSHVSPRFNTLFSAAALLNLQSPTGSDIVRTKGDEESPWVLQWVEQPARSFDYPKVFQQLANADHAIEPTISSEVFFLNPARDLILHMYDDRGMDAIAASRASLIDVYTRFEHWILDYDRDKIDQNFRD